MVTIEGSSCSSELVFTVYPILLTYATTETAGRTLQGYEVMNMMRKGQMHGVEKGDIMGQVAFVASLFGVAA